MTFEQFHALPTPDQARFLVTFAHHLTIVGREAYEVGTDGVTSPNVLRQLNEVQHRLMGILHALLSPQPSPSPHDTEPSAIMTQSSFDALASRFQWAFNRASQTYRE